jgi:hypothetical protein
MFQSGNRSSVNLLAHPRLRRKAIIDKPGSTDAATHIALDILWRSDNMGIYLD